MPHSPTAEALLRCYPSGSVRGAALTPAYQPVGLVSRHLPVAGCVRAAPLTHPAMQQRIGASAGGGGVFSFFFEPY
jgi:hypothetical protein